ncbi:Polyporopepsin [Termitomyces sp. J132]|nr:hypothetical protein H2248_001207 [Termitomyces sp. 'cryptogamus']KNZ80654.1 Polyporopepsin [Termitomyces sp. J132]
MFAASSLLATLLLALAVSANPVVVRDSPVKLPLARRLNVTSVHNLIRHDLTRAKHLRTRAEALSKGVSAGVFSSDAIVDESVDNQVVSYIASIGVGSPATTYDLIVDTGSSNTWVGAGTSYKTTSTSSRTSNRVSVTYGSGSFSGTEYTDQVTIASGLVIPSQSIGVASRATGFDGVDGILGIGPVDLTQGTLSPASSSLIPTVTDNAFSEGLISANQIGISFEPTDSEEVLNGEISWGGIDTSKFTGTITYAPLTTTSPASFYWGINQSIRYGTSTSILSSTAGIVDTGTTLLYIATDAYNRYRSATGAVVDSTTGLLRITSSQFSNLQSLFFTINGATFEFTANAQLWPRSLNTAIGGSASSIYLIVSDMGANTGSGLDFINGYAFLERFYTVFDTGNKRIGFATTPFTTATTN